MNILHLRSSSGFYGAERLLLDLATTTMQQGHSLHIAVLSRETTSLLAERALQKGLSALVYASHRWVDRNILSQLQEYIKQHSIDVLHSHDYKANFYAVLLQRIFLKKLRIVTTLHGNTASSLHVKIFESLNDMLLPFFHAVAAVSLPLRDNARRFSRNVYYLPNAICSNNTTYEDPFPVLPRPRLLMVGRFSPEKGHRFFLNALSMFTECPSVLFAGDGPQRYAMEVEAARLGISRHCYFLGYRGDIQALYQHVDLLVVPSLREGQPITILEAMAAGCPIAASNVGGISELLRQKRDAFLFTPNRPLEIYHAIQFMLSKQGRELAISAKDRAEACFLMERRAKDYMNTLYLPT